MGGELIFDGGSHIWVRLLLGCGVHPDVCYLNAAALAPLAVDDEDDDNEEDDDDDDICVLAEEAKTDVEEIDRQDKKELLMCARHISIDSFWNEFLSCEGKCPALN